MSYMSGQSKSNALIGWQKYWLNFYTEEIQCFLVIVKNGQHLFTALKNMWKGILSKYLVTLMLMIAFNSPILTCTGTGRPVCLHLSSISFGQPVAHPETRENFPPFPGKSHCSPNRATRNCATSISGTNLSNLCFPEQGQDLTQLLDHHLASCCPVTCHLPPTLKCVIKGAREKLGSGGKNRQEQEQQKEQYLSASFCTNEVHVYCLFCGLVTLSNPRVCRSKFHV